MRKGRFSVGLVIQKQGGRQSDSEKVVGLSNKFEVVANKSGVRHNNRSDSQEEHTVNPRINCK